MTTIEQLQQQILDLLKKEPLCKLLDLYQHD